MNAHQLSLTGPHRRGRKCRNLRRRIAAVLWIARTGSPWRDLPTWFGPWQNAYASYRRWSKSGLWTQVLARLGTLQGDHEYLMIDRTSSRVHQHAAGPVGGQLAQAMARAKAGLSTQAHFACDALGYPLGFILTGANVSDFDQCKPLLKSYLKPGGAAIMDKGYDSDAIRESVNQIGGTAVIAVHPNRSQKPDFDEHRSRDRHRIENLFAKLKHFRRIATRYEKLLHAYAAMLALVCIIIWIKH